MCGGWDTILPMKRALLVLFAGVAATMAQAQFSYTFDSDAQGWRRANFSETALTLTDVGPASWNSAGYIEGDDFAAYAFHVSPDLGGLDAEAAYGTNLTLDFSTTGAGALAPFVVLTDGTGALYNARTWTGGGTFESLSYTLNSSGGWLYGTTALNSTPATESQIRGVLGNLTRIGVTADVADGADFTRLDNVTINAVPEPATLAALALGSIALLSRRRSR